MPRAANDVMQSIIFSAVLDGLAALEARLRRAAQPAAARRPGDPSQRDLRRLAQGASGPIAESTRVGIHAAVEGRLCGRPAPADAADAADGPGARAPASERPARAAAWAATWSAGQRGRRSWSSRTRKSVASTQAQGQAQILGGQPRPGSDQQRRRHRLHRSSSRSARIRCSRVSI